MFMIILLMILCIVIVGVKYWFIGAILGAIFLIGIFIKLTHDEKKAHNEYLKTSSKYDKEHPIDPKDLEACQNLSTNEYVEYIINKSKLESNTQTPQN